MKKGDDKVFESRLLNGWQKYQQVGKSKGIASLRR